MKDFLKNKIIYGMILSVFMIWVVSAPMQANANPDATITPATGGDSVSIDTSSQRGGQWTSITGLKIEEGAAGDISLGLHTLTLPEGWEFNTNDAIQLSTNGAGGLTLSSNSIRPQANTFNFTVNKASSGNVDAIFFDSPLKVRPTGTTTGTGNITMTEGTIAGVDGATSFGTLTTVAGTVTQLDISTQPTNTVYGSTISETVVKTQDQFGNDSTSGLEGAETVTISKNSGSGTLSGTLSGDIISGSLSFSDLKLDGVGSYTLSASHDSLTNATSESFDITPATLTIGGSFDAEDKIYDGNTTATAPANSLTLVGAIEGDNVILTPAFAFTDKNIGTGKDVNITDGSSLDNANYELSLTGAPSSSADITAKGLTVINSVASDKVYDGNTTATITGAELSGVVDGDTVTLGNNTTGTFDNKNVGTNISVAPDAMEITGGDAGNYNLTQPSNLSADITAKGLTVTNAVASDKVYNGNTTATITGTELSGVVDGDNVTLGNNTTGTFDNKNVGTNISVDPSFMTIDGTDADNYSLTQPTGLSADITPATLTIGGSFDAEDKIYDGNTSATAPANSLTLVSAIDGDTVNLTPVFAFSDKNVGEAKTVSITNESSLSNTNYELSLIGAPSSSADITAKGLTVINSVASDKVYDGNTTATITGAELSGVVDGDNVTLGNNTTGTFDNKNVGTNISVAPDAMEITGGDAGNYNLTQPSNLSADITAKGLTVIDAVASDKVYDGNTTATITGAELSGVVDGDTVTLGNNATGTFANQNVGNSISVTSDSMEITGDDAGNYSLIQPTGLSANITAKELTITGTFTADNKEYDGNTSATAPANSLTLVGAIEGDNVILTPAFAFTDKNIGTGKDVNITDGSSLDNANYELSLTGAPSSSADITAGALDHFNVNISNSNPNIGDEVDLTITAVDAHNNIINETNLVEPYTGIAFINTNSVTANIPNSYAFIINDQGTKIINIIFNAEQENVSINVRDNNNAAIIGLVEGIKVVDNSDTTPPTISGVNSSVEKNTATVSFTSNEAGFGRLEYSYGSLTPISTANVALEADALKSISLANLICGTEYNYTIYAQDGSGNQTTDTGSFTTVACDQIDTTPPTISGVNSSVEKNTATVSFTSNEAGFGRLEYSYGSLTPISTANVALEADALKSISLANLICGTEYNYTIYAQDGSGNQTTDTGSFTTVACEEVVLSVTKTSLVKSWATQNGTASDGWHWVLDVTVPTEKTLVSMKFSDLTGAGTISAENIYFYSEQSSDFNSADDGMASITSADEFSSDVLNLTDDLDGNSSNGRQIQIKIQAAVPEGSPNGAYSASYDIVANESEVEEV